MNDVEMKPGMRQSLSLRQRAVQILARREHSRSELARKLMPYAETAEALDSLLDMLEKERLLSNTRYAAMRISVRSSRLGNLALIRELQEQDVALETIEQALAEAGDELERAARVWKKKFRALPCNPAEAAAQSRFLAGRGFSGSTIRAVLKQLKDEWNDGTG